MQTVKKFFKRKKKSPIKIEEPSHEPDEPQVRQEGDTTSNQTDPGYSIVRSTPDGGDRTLQKPNRARGAKRLDVIDVRPRMRSPTPSKDAKASPPYAKVNKGRKGKGKIVEVESSTSAIDSSPDQRKLHPKNLPKTTSNTKSPKRLALVRKGRSFVVEKDSSSDSPATAAELAHYHELEPENDSILDPVTDTSVFPGSSPDVVGASRRRQLSPPEAISEGEIVPSGDEEYNRVLFNDSNLIPPPPDRRRLSTYDHIPPSAYEKVKSSAGPDLYMQTTRPHSTPLVASSSVRASFVPRSYSESPSFLNRPQQPSHDSHSFVRALPLLRVETQSESAPPMAVEEEGLSLSPPSDDYRARLAGLQEFVVELQRDNDRLKSLAASVSEDGGALLLAQKQCDLLGKENVKLKDAVRRLNVELSRYQVRGLSERTAVGESFSSEVNVNELNPLLRAYDEKLHEKEAILSSYEEYLEQCKRQLADKKHENETLKKTIQEIKSANPLSRNEWLKIQEQTKLVLEENSLLIEQQEAEKRKFAAQIAAQDAEAVTLKEKISLADKGTCKLEARVKELERENRALREECNRIKEDSLSRMSVEEHRTSLEECSRVAAELEQQFRMESVNVRERLEAVNKEKNALSVHLADSEADVLRLETQIETLTHSQKKQKKVIVLLRDRLRSYKEKGSSATGLVQKAMLAAEKAQMERDLALEKADSHRQAHDEAVRKMIESDVRVNEVRQKLESLQMQASRRLEEAKLDSNERDRDYQENLRRYKAEIKRLRNAVRRKKDQLDVFYKHKQKSDIESLLQSVAASRKGQLDMDASP